MAKRVQQKPRRRVGLKEMGRRGLSLLMAMIMVISLIQISAFADDGLTAEQRANKNAQIVTAGETLMPENGKGNVQMTKTAELTDEEGKFLMTLQVKTKDEIKQTTTEVAPTIDVVLVIDNSSSMNSGGRLDSAKQAATQFVNSFLGENPDGNRNVAVVTYGKTASTKSGLSHDLEALRGTAKNGEWKYDWVWVEGHWEGIFWIPGHYEWKEVWVPAAGDAYEGGAINNITELSNTGTNIQAGLKEAREILNGSRAEYKYVLLLSDGEPTYYYEGNQYQPVDQSQFIAVKTRYSTYQQDYIYKSFDYTDIDGDGSDTGKNHAYNTVSEALLLKEAGIEIYGVGIDLQNSAAAKYTMYNSVTRDEGGYESHYINCTAGSGSELAEQLNKAFEIIETNITVKTNAWIVSDTLGDDVTFAGFETDKQAGAQQQGKQLTWNLKSLAAFDHKDGDWYVYTCQYYVTLNRNARDGQPHDTNKVATLTYSFEDDLYEEDFVDENGVQHYAGEQKLYTSEFAKPQVKGYRVDLSFTKIGSDTKQGLPRAQFTLADDSDVSAWSDSCTSDNNGKVAFANIPSGYTYTLTETAAPENYNKVDPITVTVKYGKLTTDSTAEGGANITDGKLEDPAKQTYTDVTITKTWQKPAGEATPDSITVTLKQDNREYKTVKLTPGVDGCTAEGNTWKYTFEDLPKTDLSTGKDYAYTVEEAAVDGYTTTYSEDGLNIVNTASGKTIVVVEKKWILPEGMNTDDMAITVTLTQNGEKMTGEDYKKTICGDNSVTFGNLEKYDENGQLYTYDVVESGNSYTPVSKNINTSAGYTQISLVNTVAYEVTNISGVKTWNDGGDTVAHDAITVELYADGTKVDEKIVSEEDHWAYSFDNLDRYEFTRDENNNNNITAVREIKYTVKEVGVDGYTATISGNNITNTRTGYIDLIIYKNWVAESVPNEEVTVKLYADGVDTGKSATFNDSYTFEDLNKYDASGEEIQYSVVETPVSGYTTSYGKMELLSEDVYAITVTNTQNGFDPDDEVLITVTKTWQQPSTVEAQTADFYLCIDGKRSDYSVSITGNGSTSFAPMPRYHAVRDEATGETEYVEINYSVEEDVPSNYTVFVDEVVGPDSNGNIYYHFTNTIRGTTSLSLEKTWVQPDGMDTPMATFEIQRSVDGTNWENAGYITLMDGKTSETRNNLDKYDANGQLYLYRVVENSVAGYSSSMTGGIQEDGSFAFQATNTINQATADITVSKTWIDGNTPNSQRPDVTIDLLQDGVVINSVTFGWSEADGAVMATVNGASIKATVSEDGNTWSIKFMGQPLYNENRTARYEYSVQEQNVPENYKAAVSGTTVTNQLTGTISIPVTKYWVDPGVADRPDITLRLKGSDGSEYVMLVSDDSGAPVVTLNGVSLPITAEGNTWTFTVGNLPEYTDTGAKITYTLSEDAVDGYTTQTVEGQPFAIKNVIEQENGITITPVKFWENMDVEGVYTPVLPETITVALFRDGAMVDGTKQTVSVGEDGTCEFKPYEELAKYNLTTGQKYKYEVLELDAKGSPVKNGETISFGTDNDYTVTYREMEVDTGDNYQVVITNTFTVPAKYLWVVKTHYVHYDYNGNVIGSFNDQTEIFKETESKTVSANPADYTVRDGLTYEYDADNTGNKTQVLLEQQNYLYELNLYYTLTDEEPTDPGDGGGGGTTYYNLVVKYLEEGTDEVLASPYTARIAAGRSYDVTAQTQKAIDGYEISQVTGDDVTGYMNGNREIIVYYTVDIDDGETPLDPGPGGDGDGDGTDIGDGEVPLDPGPGGDGDGTDIGDENVPLVPATGDNLALWVMAAVASAAGLVYLTVAGKKREKDNT